MKKCIAIFTFIILSFFSNNTFAQGTSDKELARHYYQNAEYYKALLYYERLYEANVKNSYYFQLYLDCLLKTDDFKTAEKVAKKSIKNAPEDLNLYVNLGQIYSFQNDLVEEQKTYENALKKIDNSTPNIVIRNLGYAFERNNNLNYAIKTYEKGLKIYPSVAEFEFKIANVYGLQGEFDLMIESYLNLIAKQPNYVNTAKNHLSNRLGFDNEEFKGSEALRIAILKRVQKQPGEKVYNDLLIWYFIQIKDFDAAFVQVKAFDKKQNANGYLVLDFGKICSNNKAYTNAIEAFDYIINLGKNGRFYQTAIVDRMHVLNSKLITEDNYAQEDLLKLKSDYISTINYVGKTSISIPLQLELAHLLAYYIHDIDSSINVLESALNTPGVNPLMKAKCKMTLADISVFKGNVWDAALLYAQVEKQFKDEPIGHEAKFRAARIFYFEGDFGLAQSQLDVLKTSTSKLIANDAFELSLLITDNLNMDTTAINMKRFARADLLLLQNRFKEALAVLDTINESVVYHSLNDEILYKRYEIAYKQGDYISSEKYLLEIATNYSYDILADNALFKLGELYENKKNDVTKAAEYYKQLLFNYSGSLFAVEARKRYRKIVGEL